jgi:hypothetical protein
MGGGMVWFFGQMFFIPLQTFVFGMERILTTMQVADGPGIASIPAPSSAPVPVQPSAPLQPSANSSPAPLQSNLNPGTAAGGSQIQSLEGKLQEREPMDENENCYLNDDKLTLVDYEIVFIKRPYEHVFITSKSELLKVRVDEPAFIGSKIAEFVLDIRANPVKVPESWKGYAGVGDDLKLRELPPEDLIYLRVPVKVTWRHDREKLKYEEEKLYLMKKQTNFLEVISKKP